MWSHYGLEPTERFVEIESPAVRLRIQEVGSGEADRVRPWRPVACSGARSTCARAGWLSLHPARPARLWSELPRRLAGTRAPDRCPQAHGRRRRRAWAGADPRHRPLDRWRMGPPASAGPCLASRQDRDPGRFTGAGRNAAPGIFPDPGVADRSPHHPSSAKPGPGALDAPPGWAWPEPGCRSHPGRLLRLARRARP